MEAIHQVASIFKTDIKVANVKSYQVSNEKTAQERQPQINVKTYQVFNNKTAP